MVLETLVVMSETVLAIAESAPELRHCKTLREHRRRQTLMFSATLDHAEVNDIANEMLDAP